MKHVSMTIDIDTIYIEWRRGIKVHKRLEDAWPNTLSEKDYHKSNLINAPHTFEDIIALLHKIIGLLGIFLAYYVR